MSKAQIKFSEMLSLLWYGEHNAFETILESKGDTSDLEEKQLKEGDLILRPMETKGLFYHVGIYCGESEVVDFAGQPNSSLEKKERSTCCSLSSLHCSSFMDGKVTKVGVKTFVRDKMFCVIRLKCGIPKGFRERVKKAMNDTLKYNAWTFNCLHFALELLGKKQLLDRENDVDTTELQNMEDHKKLI